MEEERDFVVFTDEDGTEFELDVIDYFDYENEEYAILAELPEEDSEEEQELEVYIMKVETNGEYEEFLPPDDDKMEMLSAIAEKRLEALECEDGCSCGEHDCDCGEHDCNCDGGCDCGCHK